MFHSVPFSTNVIRSRLRFALSIETMNLVRTRPNCEPLAMESVKDRWAKSRFTIQDAKFEFELVMNLLNPGEPVHHVH